eukprot:jgi/Astpho2/7531/e_gw1.00114.262.1_t
MAIEAAGITFDEDYRIRVLDAEHFQATKALQNDCSMFIGKMAELNSLVQTYLEVLDKQAARIEAQKLKAIGARNAAATLEEGRKQREREQQGALRDKQQLLERLLVEEQSLVRARQEQDVLIAQLTDSSSTGVDIATL